MKRLFFTCFFILLLCSSAQAGPIKDDAGNTFYFDKPYKRIISLYAAHTENLFAMGLEEEIIGVTNNEDYPSVALEKPRFSTHDGVEKFLDAKPDLVLIRPMQYRGYPSLWRALKRHGIRIIALQPNNVSEMYDYWRTLGRLTGRELQAEQMVGRFKEGLEFAHQRLERIPKRDRPRVFFESIHRKYATFAPDSMPIFVVEMAGGVNVAYDAKSRHGTNIATYGLERMLGKSADIDVYLAQRGAMNDISPRDIMNIPAASRIKAVRDRNVFLVDERLVSRPTLRLLEGIEIVHRLLHPEINY